MYQRFCADAQTAIRKYHEILTEKNTNKQKQTLVRNFIIFFLFSDSGGVRHFNFLISNDKGLGI